VAVTANGLVIRAIRGRGPQVDPAALARIQQPTFLVAATESPPAVSAAPARALLYNALQSTACSLVDAGTLHNIRGRHQHDRHTGLRMIGR
jgi:hypothetical protein